MGGDRGVDAVVCEELGDGFDHQELEDTFRDYLVEEAPAGGGYDDRCTLGTGLGVEGLKFC